VSTLAIKYKEVGKVRYFRVNEDIQDLCARNMQGTLIAINPTIEVIRKNSVAKFKFIPEENLVHSCPLFFVNLDTLSILLDELRLNTSPNN
jgi:hypothetical protein